jgi:ABC-type transport system involved in multi-copper enzyme maturation permease subunit
MTRKIFALGSIGLLHLVKTRMYLNLLVAGAIMVIAALLMDQLSAGEGGRVFLDVGLAFVSLVVAALAGIVGVTGITRELETQQIQLVLARPVARYEIILGRFATIAGLVVISNLVLGGLLALVLVGIGADGAWRALGAALFASGEGFVVGAVALFFGVKSSSTLSALFTTTVFLLGRLTMALGELLDDDKFDATLKPILSVVHRLLPQLHRFDLTNWARTGTGTSVGDMIGATAYGLLYVVIMLSLSAFRFERRDCL